MVCACAGSAFLTLLDARERFNRIANADRARQTLAILARNGQYLPRCLTFEPTNNPEDFACAAGRSFALGEGRRGSFRDIWRIYAGNIATRMGRVIDRVSHAEEERRARVSTAKAKRAEAVQSENARDAQMTSAPGALRALRFRRQATQKGGTRPGCRARGLQARTGKRRRRRRR